MQSNSSTLKPAAAKTTSACGAYGCYKAGNNTDVFPSIDNTTVPCGESNCGIPTQRFRDQGIAPFFGQPPADINLGKRTAALVEIFDDADVGNVTTATMLPPPIPKDTYQFYQDKSYINALGAPYNTFAPRGWSMPDPYSGKYIAKGTGAKKDASDFEAWYRYEPFASQRYQLGHLPVLDAALAQESAQGVPTWAKWLLGVSVGAALIAAVGGGAYYVMK